MTAIILAAGFSKRFGGKKLLIDINKKPMLLHVVDLVLSMNFEDTILVYHDDEIANAVRERNIRCVYNADAANGLSTSVKCGVQNSIPLEDYIFFTGDQPFIDLETVKSLLSAFIEGKGSIIVPKYGGHKGNPVIFAAKWRDRLMGITGDLGGRGIIEEYPEEVYYINILDPKAGMDIDTREQYTYYIERNE